MRRHFVDAKPHVAGRAAQSTGWRNILKTGIVILLAIAVQGVWSHRMQIGFAMPDFSLLTLGCLALLTNPAGGAWTGFFIGLLQGAMVAQMVGSHILSRMGAGFLAGWIPVRFERKNPLMPVLVCMLVVGMSEMLLYVLAPSHDFNHWVLRMTGKAIYNGLLALPAYALLKRFLPPEPEEEEI
jgi:rod shape-determining protein MreD